MSTQVIGRTLAALLDEHGRTFADQAAADGDLDVMLSGLQELPRIGPTGAQISCREVQAVWLSAALVRSALGRRATRGRRG